ncbi:MAG: rRNA pseudouridine synthase, partial [Clostridia bacterium]|nr:rRNA pseudouridine synthase [Clostridia bacterium]
MRLDKFLSVTGAATRTEAKKAIRARAVSVNGVAASSAEMQINPEIDEVLFFGEKVIYREYTYIMVNKPQGVVSATEDGRDKTVLDLLPANIKKDKLFPCGRLDKDTLGLVIVTDNGELAHELLSPRSHVSKSYKFKAAEPISECDLRILENGVA